MLKDDLLKLHEAFELVTRKYTPQEFCDLLNRCEGFPIALHEIIERNGWEDWTDDSDSDLILIDNDRNQTVRLENDGRAYVD